MSSKRYKKPVPWPLPLFAAEGRDRATITCPICGGRVGESLPVVKAVVVADYVDEETAWEHREPTVIGRRVQLENGFVPAPVRHQSGVAWFVTGKRASSRPPKIRTPAIVTCRCGQEIELRGDERTSDYAEADAERLADMVLDDLAEESGEASIQSESDLARGK